MRKVINYFIGQRLMVNLFTVLILGAGTCSALDLQREVFPNINFDIVSIRTIWVGASAIDMERLITNEIEESVDEVSGIKEYRSESLENLSIVTVTIDPDEPEPDNVIDDLRSSIDQLRDLPVDAESPTLTEIRSDLNPIIEWAVLIDPEASSSTAEAEEATASTASTTSTAVAGIESPASVAKASAASKEIGYRELRDIAEQLEQRFLGIPEVANVTLLGWRDLEIFVDLDPNKMQQYTIGSNDIINTLRDRNVSLPGGDVLYQGKESIVRTVAEFSGAKEIAGTPIRVNDTGSNLLVQDVAQVYEDFEEAEYQTSTETYESINLTVLKKRSADTIFLSDKTKAIVAEFEKTLPDGIRIEKVFDYSFFVKRRLSLLTTNLYQGAIFVFFILLYFLGWKFASFTALSIPFAFTFIFLILQFVGSSINLLTLFGLIMVSGMLTDPAIVVSENIVRLREQGKSVKDAVVQGAAEVFAPIMTTINTTLATFAPLMLMTGIFGKFVSEIPYVIVIGVIASLFPAFLFLTVNSFKSKRTPSSKKESATSVPVAATSVPAAATNESASVPASASASASVPDAIVRPRRFFRFGLRKAKASQRIRGTGDTEDRAFQESAMFKRIRDVHFRRFINVILTYRKTSLLFMFILIAGSVPAYISFGSFKLFPNQVDSLSIKVEAPIGTTQQEVHRYLKVIGQYVKQIPATDLDTFSSRAGVQTVGATDPFTKRGNHYGMMTVHLFPEADRELDLLDIINDLKKKTSWMLADAARETSDDAARETSDDAVAQGNPEAMGKIENLTISRLTGGPPVGQAIAIELISNDLDLLYGIAEEYSELLAKIDGLFDIGDDVVTGKSEFLVYVDDMKTGQTRLNASQIATAVNTSAEGTIATSIRRPSEEVDIRVRYAKEYRENGLQLDRIFLSNRFGNMIPLENVTKLESGLSIASIKHVDGRRMINVFSDMDDKKMSATRAARLIDDMDDEIRQKYPSVQVQFSGENEDTTDSLKSLGQMSLIGFFIIFCLLAILFRSMLQPFIIMTSVLFAGAGVIYAFILHGIPLSFLSLVGLIGLAGVVVNDPIVLTDFSNQIRREKPNLSNKEVALQAALTRLRPNFLTSSTTIAGLIPTAYGIGGGDPFLIPTALAFCWGLTLATVMSLFFHPILIYYEYTFKDKMQELRARWSG